MGVSLTDAVKFGNSETPRRWPTPQANDWKTGQDYSEADRGHTPQLRHLITGQLNPTFVEWLMGFPRDWTEA
jgi:hypothetical protein